MCSKDQCLRGVVKIRYRLVLWERHCELKVIINVVKMLKKAETVNIVDGQMKVNWNQ